MSIFCIFLDGTNAYVDSLLYGFGYTIDLDDKSNVHFLYISRWNKCLDVLLYGFGYTTD